MKQNSPTHEEITARAYQIFVERGCPEGRDLEHWLEAEAQLNTSVQGTRQSQPLPGKQDPSIGKAPRASTRPTAGRRS